MTRFPDGAGILQHDALVRVRAKQVPQPRGVTADIIVARPKTYDYTVRTISETAAAIGIRSEMVADDQARRYSLDPTGTPWRAFPLITLRSPAAEPPI